MQELIESATLILHSLTGQPGDEVESGFRSVRLPSSLAKALELTLKDLEKLGMPGSETRGVRSRGTIALAVQRASEENSQCRLFPASLAKLKVQVENAESQQQASLIIVDQITTHLSDMEKNIRCLATKRPRSMSMNSS